MSFRDNLRHLRAAHSMTQEQLAALLGVSRQSVTKWESERAYPEMDKLLSLCQVFGCSLDDLVRGDLAVVALPAPSDVAPPVPDNADEYNEAPVSCRQGRRMSVICGVIMLVSTALALGMLFAPFAMGAAPDHAWGEAGVVFAAFCLRFFWLPWVLGAVACAMAALFARFAESW
ncbi:MULTISPECIES: helix-turn-helix transcriptional regulator [unclassified Adlercreutzia]|uniref:helix-turn-helix transcriptional regulator n=1 Tax=unclassified Adlercreutzia TaxID=2636013 RepID=UPI00198038BA|nr:MULTISPECIES: helix-turn-helix transcriptional regulator [unclassified Adlercreutzia]